MQITFNPKDTNTFASASLDRTVKVCVISALKILVGHNVVLFAVISFFIAWWWYPNFCQYQIWSLGSPDPNFTLDGQSKGVNCVDYFTGGDRPYLITGSDDQTAKVCHMHWIVLLWSCMYTVMTLLVKIRFGTTKQRVAFKHLKDMHIMCLLYVSIQSYL